MKAQGEKAIPSAAPRPWQRVVAGALAALAASACGGGESSADRRPDVVFIVIDTLRADHLGCYGYERDTSPRLDRLAEEGALFTDVTAQSAWTLPSMVSLLSGRYLTDYRDFPEEEPPLLAETFRDAGYATVGVVGNVLLRPEAGFGRGFDHYDARPGAQPEGVETVRARSIEELEAALWEPVDAALARAAGEGGSEGRAPLFLYLHPFDPHHPYIGDPRLDPELPLMQAPPVQPEGWQAAALAELGPPPPQGRAGWELELRDLRRRRGLYDQEIRLTDEGLARVLDGLEERGLLEHSIVAVVSDHGESLWERTAPMPAAKLRATPPPDFFYQDHGAYLYEEAVRTPMVLWGAGVPAGRRIGAAVENVDLFPTLLELCRVPARGELHGRTLGPLLRDEEPDTWRDSVHSHILFSTSVREVESNTKLIQPTEHGERVGVAAEVFRLGADPLERTTHEDAAVQAGLEQRLEVWRRRYPTPSTFGQKPDAKGQKLLGDLGYTEVHTGG